MPLTPAEKIQITSTTVIPTGAMLAIPIVFSVPSGSHTVVSNALTPASKISL